MMRFNLSEMISRKSTVIPVISGVLVFLLLACAVCAALLPMPSPAVDEPLPTESLSTEPPQPSETTEEIPNQTELPTGEDNIGYDIFS